ncbi:MAG: hypothetical protein FWD51_00045 [Betaproteobacteria bacterium]|nr:hypothetical protein [Betaproteobacteria bacterium]
MKSDLTRWNRAGLKRFRYIDGNAATYLEALRQELFVRLAGWDMELLGLKLDSNDDRAEVLKKYIEEFGKDHQQAHENYLDLNDNPGSIALEIVRSFARAAHVLTEHLDAYANEGFLGTATQWENVRRLVHGLDYHPKPPASAETHLVLHAKPGQSGLVARGLQIKHTPEKGSPVIFETLEDIEVDTAFNALRLKDWNHSPGKIENSSRLVLDRIVEDFVLDEPVVIEDVENGVLQPRLLKSISIENECTVLHLESVTPISGSQGDLFIHLKPAEKLQLVTPVLGNETIVTAVKRLGRGDLCVAVAVNNLKLRAAYLQYVTVATGGVGQSTLLVDNWVGDSGSFTANNTFVFGKFKERVRLRDWDVNETPISGKTLTLEKKEVAKILRQGQRIVIEQEAPEPRKYFQTTVQGVDKETGIVTLALDLPAEYITGRTVIRANVVQAGHGETQPEKILGSGNATLSNQEFLFPVSGVSFVSDKMEVSGVKADISVIVDGETWTQVSRFNQSEPTDIHYVVRMTEEGHLRIVFGDGVNGRRLPTGENNVRIAWRMGSGIADNLGAGLLKKPAQPHPRIEAINQPFSISGDNDEEPVTSLRRSAPTSLITMGRAVSVIDFAALAESHSSVWNARAELKSPGNIVCVTVVPAQGQELNEDSAKTIKTFLLSRAIPGVNVELEEYKSQPLNLKITLSINRARFDPEIVQAEVKGALLERFTLKNSTIGAPVYLSDVYQCVEAVRGVENSICMFEGSDDQTLYPEPNEVFHIKESTENPVGFINIDIEGVRK